jgi:hypothetical protein
MDRFSDACARSLLRFLSVYGVSGVVLLFIRNSLFILVVVLAEL